MSSESALLAPSCPDENTLTRIAQGATGLLVPAIETHLDSCESCRRAMAAAASGRTLPSAPSSTDVRPGVRIGRYEIERELGRGGMGVVYMARDLTLDRRVALKLLHARRDEVAQSRLLREAQVMAKLAHPNVVPVFELGDWQGDLYLVMELVNGLTLQAWVKGGRRTRREILNKFIDAGRGLAAAHAAGVVHRDFKPANVLVGLDGRARVTDFGLSRPGPALELPPMASPLVTREGALVGTIVYMAPEQLDGKAADERSDQFSFCVALCEALGGERPFAGENWSSLAVSLSQRPQLSRVPRSMRAVLRKGLSIDASRRYASMASLLDALERSQRLGWNAVGATAVAAMLSMGLIVTWPELSRAPQLSRADQSLVSEVFAARDLPKGTVISYELLAMHERPASTLSPNTVTKENVPAVIGMMLTADVKQGDGLNWAQFEKVEQTNQRSPMVVLEPIAQAKEDLGRCMTLRDNPESHGLVVMHWELDANGRATSFSSNPQDPTTTKMTACLTDVLKALKFPAGPAEPIEFPFKY